MKAKATLVFASLAVLSSVAASGDSPFDQFAGSWRLVSAEGHSTDGSITYDWGQTPLGRVMFDAGGRLSLHLVDPDRPNFESGDFLRPTPD